MLSSEIGFFMETIENTRFYCRVIKGLSADEQQKITAFSLWPHVTEYLAQTLQHSPLTLLSQAHTPPAAEDFCHSKPVLFQKIDSDIRLSREFLVNKVEYSVCWNLYFHVLYSALQAETLNSIEKMILCSGNGIAEKAMAMVCRQRGIETRFIELSNLPNKVFIDRLGANARSELALHPELLDKYPAVSDEFHQSWMDEYEKGKKGIPLQAMNNPCANIINLLSSDKVLTRYSRDFIFLPLQVSADTQLWINADKRNADAIHYAAKLAGQENKMLVVKIHPAERDPHELETLAQLKNKLGFKISQENTVQLIKRSSKVLTINSTVGLEAMLYDKPLEILGRSFYQQMNKENMKKYIHHYLFTGVEVRSASDIPRDVALAFLAR
ncbi:hypothetical protein GJV11_02465 [Enterobacteriaceae bacterium RIT693]|jgi:hypothetical protein|nr:hypothetical protein [Enterobacteriaceae bacterium RIT693]